MNVRIPRPGRAARAVLAATIMAVLLSPASASADRTGFSRAPVVAFQAAGSSGGGVLTPGTTFPPTSRAQGYLLRRPGSLEVTVVTDGLPAGAYTMWWMAFDTPDGCVGPCDVPDLFNPAANASVFYATGGEVRADGHGLFRAVYRVGGSRGTPGTQDLLGSGPIDPMRAEIHNVIKYHGPASPDPAVRHLQMTTVHGSCLSGANAVDLGPPFGVQCFDPQVVVHPRH